MSEITQEWTEAVQAAVRVLLPATFVGQIEINCFLGNISNITVKQSFKKENAK
jgi:hypothetical protein